MVRFDNRWQASASKTLNLRVSAALPRCTSDEWTVQSLERLLRCLTRTHGAAEYVEFYSRLLRTADEYEVTIWAELLHDQLEVVGANATNKDGWTPQLLEQLLLITVCDVVLSNNSLPEDWRLTDESFDLEYVAHDFQQITEPLEKSLASDEWKTLWKATVSWITIHSQSVQFCLRCAH